MRIFEFKKVGDEKTRSFLVAFPESKINTIESQEGSQNTYLKVNGIRVWGSYTDLIDRLRAGDDRRL